MQQNTSGGMDGRMLLAFALMIGLWIIYSQFIAPPPRKPAPETTQSELVNEDAGLAEVDPATAASSPPAQADVSTDQYQPRKIDLTQTEEGVEREIVVEGELIRAVFTTRGGTLKSLTLNNYTNKDNELVELVQDLPGALGLAIEGPAGLTDLSGSLFNVEESSEPSSGNSSIPIKVLRFSVEGEMGVSGGTPIRVERTYRIDPSQYDMEMDVSVSGIENFRKDHRLVLGWEKGIPNLETQTKMEKGSKAAIALLAEELIKDGYGGGRMGCGCGGGKADQGGERPYDGMIHWAGVKGKYFGAILIPEVIMEGTFIAASEPEAAVAGMRLLLPLEYEGTSNYRFAVFAGPIDYGILKDLEAKLDRKVTRLADFGPKFFAPISKAMLWFMVKTHSIIPNYGIVIILLSILIRVLFWPLNVKALRSQQAMQALKPELDALNKQYKDNPEVRTKKMMELHKKHGVSPLGGCLPMLPQMPVIYALYGVMMNAIELRKAPFGLWIQDLSAPDKIFAISGVPIHILPLLMALTMFIQTKMTPTDPKQAPMMMMMPLMMVFFFYTLPSGLVLYWTITNILMVGQQFLMKRNAPPAPDSAIAT